MILSKILVPMLNANEPEATLIEVLLPEGYWVKPGDILFTIETTKAASDIESDTEGFIRVNAVEGQTMQVGDVLAYITSDKDEPLPLVVAQDSDANTETNPSQLRITEPARRLAFHSGIALDSLPTDRLITETYIQSKFKNSGVERQPLDPKKIIVYGAGGHAKAIMEMIMEIGQHQIIGIIDDDPVMAGQIILGYPVLGDEKTLGRLMQEGVGVAANGVGGIININLRKKIFDRLADNGFQLPSLCHPRATTENSARINEGVQVFANAYIGSSVILEERCMVNTGAIISHDCVIGQLSHIAPGAMLAGGVQVGKQVLVGMGVTTAIGITIGDGSRIGNGASILRDVPVKTIVPAGKVWN